VPTVPNASSASTTASAKLRPDAGSSASKTRPSANTRREAGTPSLRDTAWASISLARWAASMAAFPIISVTRLE
jgi:hypothetical protein